MSEKIKVLAILVEPAEYTLGLIKNIYVPIGVDVTFLKSKSLAGTVKCERHALEAIPLHARISTMVGWLSKYDAFNLNGYTGSSCVIFILLNIFFFRKPFSIDSDTELRIPQNKLKRLIKWFWLHFLFTRKYCYGFAGGSYGHKDLFRHYGMPEERIFLMPMVVDNSQYSRKELPKPHKPFRFGYLGRLVSHKQVDKVIEALPDGCELHVVGDGEERLKLETMANGKSIVFHGKAFDDEKIKLLHSFDCLVLYSYYEPWGLVVNEALASGIPVIVSDKVGARKDLVEGDNPTGLVAKWNDVNDLAEKMRQIAHDLALRKRLMECAVRRMARWDYNLYMRMYVRFLKELRGPTNG